MKRTLTLLALAVLTVGLLGSCSKIYDRLDDLEEQVDRIENTDIASINQQVTAINASISDLTAADVAINGKIAELKQTAGAQQALIDALKEADQALGQKDAALEERIATLEGQAATINGQIETLEDADKAINTRIDELRTYVNTELGKTKDWATETFATLDQYQQTADDLAALSVTVTGISTTLAGVQTSIAGLDTKIDGIDAALQGKITDANTELEGKIADLKTELEGKIATEISASETSVKTWINELLEGYYTIAQVDAKITGLNTAIDAAKGISKQRIDSVATELTALKTAVDTAKTHIRTEYKTAIATAISEYDGKIRKALKDSILAVNGRADALGTRVTTLEGKVLALEGKVDKLLAMIQSVSITPAYSDGSVEAVNGILTLKCIVSPAEALIGMESLKDSLLLYADFVKVKTKAATPAYMEIPVTEASVLDAAQGAITLKADISEYLPEGADKALTVAVNIKNGISHFTTEFVPVTGPDIPEGALSGVFSVSATKKVHFSQGNLYWDGVSFKLEANQYDVQSSWSASHVSHFFWSKNASVAYASIYSETSTKTTDVFFTNATAETAKSDFTINGVTGKYRTLSTTEWQYLINKENTENIRKGKYKYGVTVCGKANCLILAPDDFEGTIEASYDAAAWASAEAAGLVCLPAAGYRINSTIQTVGNQGDYWSSSARDESLAYYVYFNSSDVKPGNDTARNTGCSVRLITECQ